MRGFMEALGFGRCSDTKSTALRFLMPVVAQLVERQIVVLDVTGSTPVDWPSEEGQGDS